MAGRLSNPAGNRSRGKSATSPQLPHRASALRGLTFAHGVSGWPPRPSVRAAFRQSLEERGQRDEKHSRAETASPCECPLSSRPDPYKGSRAMSTNAAAIDVVELDPKRWLALAVVAVAFFMTVLDASIVTIALPTIASDLGFSETSLQWIINAYVLTLGALLLLSGRVADLVGRRLVFMLGVLLFTAASLACGLSESSGALIAARAVQGLGAALVTTSALSIVSNTFTEGAERNKALGLWGALAGGGAAVGVILGGVLTKYAGWEWVFFVNVPFGIAVLAASLPLIRESRSPDRSRNLDPLGAITSSAGLVLFVYGIAEAPSNGWGSAVTIGCLVASAVLLVAFVVLETRVSPPPLPLSILKTQSLAGANVLGALLPAAMLAMLFLMTLYFQRVLGYSAIETGIAFLPVAVTSFIAAVFAETLVTRRGWLAVLGIGLMVSIGGLIFLTQLPVHGEYWRNVFPALVLMGIGTTFAFIPISVAALAGVSERQYGLASGLINTSEQIGGAIGIAVAASVLSTRVTNLIGTREDPNQAYIAEHGADALPTALTSGITLAFWSAVGFAVLALVVRELLVPVPQWLHLHPPHLAAFSRNGLAPNRTATWVGRHVLGGREPVVTTTDERTPP